MFTFQNFTQTGSEAHKQRNTENSERNEAVEVAVLRKVAIIPALNTRKLFDLRFAHHYIENFRT